VSSISIRFPDGTREFRYPPRPLAVGDVLNHDGVRYRVVSVSNNGDGRDNAVVELMPLLLSEEGGIRLEEFV
jgi:hypothetical protein